MKTFALCPDFGDCIYALPTVKKLGGGIIYLKDGQGARTKVSKEWMDVIRPLLMLQPYVGGVKPWNGEDVDYDFTGFRAGHSSGKTLAESQRICASPNKIVDFKQPWLTLEIVDHHGRPVFARSTRYHNPEGTQIWKRIMWQHPNAAFIGLPNEHREFEKEIGGIEYLPTKDLLQIAKLIAGSSIFAGNQSAPFAIAEGLKHNSILEVYPKAPDCIYPRENVKHIWKLDDISEEKLVLGIVIQYHPGDQELAFRLLDLMAELEDSFRDDVELFLCPRFDSVEPVFNGVRCLKLRDKFRIKAIHQSKDRKGTGWPGGCNDLWQSTMMQLNKLKREDKIKSEAVLTLDADCLPIDRDWINKLKTEWAIARNMGKEACGMLLPEHGEHINGNAIFDASIISKHKELCLSSGPWDMYHAALLKRITKPATLIEQQYRKRDEITEQDILDARKRDVVLIHGIQHHSGIETVRKMLCPTSKTSDQTSDKRISSAPSVNEVSNNSPTSDSTTD